MGMDEVGDDDLILAGGMANGAPVDESAYKKLIMDSAGGYPGMAGTAAVGGPPIEVKTWIQWYLIQEDHDFMVEIEREYITDKFNLIKLREQSGLPSVLQSKRRYKEALRLIISNKVPSEDEL